MNDTKTAKIRSWGGIRERRGRYYVHFRAADGSRPERGPFSTAKAADKMRTRARALIEGGMPVAEVLAEVFGDLHGSRLTFRDATPLYIAWGASPDPDGKPRKKASTLRTDTVRLRAIQKAPWAGKPLGLVTAGDLERWHNARRSGSSSSTANRDLSLVSALFKWAGRPSQGYVESNPARRVEKFSERGRERETYLTATEARVLLAVVSPALRPIVAAALATGARRGELMALRWADVDFDAKHVVFRPETEKAGRGRVVPLTDDLRSLLLETRAARKVAKIDRTDPVFPITPWTLRTGLAAAIEAAGDEIAEEKRDKVTFHTLRHTAASLRVAAGVPLYDVAKILGHSTLAVTMRYAHFAPEAGRRAIAALSDALAGRTPVTAATRAEAGG